MEREIKFRAWHVATRTMTYDPLTITGHVNGEHKSDEHINNFFDADAQRWQILMQYTGLKDKNGVEIYEGDIVKDGRVYLYEVKWVTLRDSDENSGGYNVGVGFNVYPPDDDDPNVYEVIGNIWEQPELLEAAS